MTFKDILKDSFLKNYELMNLETVDILIIMGITALLALYMFFIYRFMTRKGFYNKAFNIALPAVALITAAIIITIQSSVIVSLGMVGALSIVEISNSNQRSVGSGIYVLGNFNRYHLWCRIACSCIDCINYSDSGHLFAGFDTSHKRCQHSCCTDE